MRKFSLRNIYERLNEMPMAAMVASLVVGILFSDVVDVAVWLWVVLVFMAAAAAVCVKEWREVVGLFAIFCFGAGVYDASRPSLPPYDEHCRVVLDFTSESVVGERYCSSSAEVLSGDGVERGVRLRIYSPPAVRFEEGERVEAMLCIRRFDYARGDFGRLMYHRGYLGSAFLGREQIIGYQPRRTTSLHTLAIDRLRAMMPEGEARAVTLAMGVGERSEIGAATYAAYSRTGASHLLAVSGLHVGILFMLINLLVWPLALLRHGNAIGTAVVIGALWLYVFVCGGSPSAVRAAAMFSVMQLCLSAVRGYVSGNVLCATAFVMLVVNPDLLFDLSFRMSFAAVAGIIFWGVPLMRSVHIPYRLPRALCNMLAIGWVASLWVMPLVSHTFGVVSLVGVVLGPLVILSANLLLLATLLSLLLPRPLAGLMAQVAEWMAALQNEIIHRAADVGGAYVEYAASEQTMWIAYGVYVAITIFLWGFRRDNTSVFHKNS